MSARLGRKPSPRTKGVGETGKYFVAYYQRRARGTSQVITIYQERCAENEEAYIGIPPRKRSIPGCSSGVPLEDGSDWCDVNGDYTTADGALIWLRSENAPDRRVAIVCPNPRIMRARMSDLWRQWGVTLYVESPKEAEELATHTVFKSNEIIVVSPQLVLDLRGVLAVSS